MTLLKDLIIKSKKPTMPVKEAEKIEYSDIKGEGAEIGIARKHMAVAIKKGYQKQAAVNYTVSHLKGQGWSVATCTSAAEQAWKDLQEEPISEGMTDPEDIANNLQEMLDQMRDIMNDVKRLLRNAPSDVQQHAKHYWVAHIVTALGSDHDYIGGTSKYDTMEATIQKLRDEVGQDDE